MKKSLLSIFISLSILFSVFSIITVNAQEEYTVVFSNNMNWSEVYLYAWRGDGLNENQNAGWHGVKMEFFQKNSLNQDQYRISIKKIFPYIIFNDGGDEQTVDITFNPNVSGYYLDRKNGEKWEVKTWIDKNPTDPTPTETETVPDSSTALETTSAPLVTEASSTTTPTTYKPIETSTIEPTTLPVEENETTLPQESTTSTATETQEITTYLTNPSGTEIQESTTSQSVTEPKETSSFVPATDPQETTTVVPATDPQETTTTTHETESQEKNSPVLEPTKAKEVQLSLKPTKYDKIYKKGASFSIRTEVKLAGSDISSPKLKYTSSNSKVAKVSSKGVVSVKGCGKAAITVSVSEVYDKVLNQIIYVSGKKSLNIKITPDKIKLKKVKGKDKNKKKRTVKLYFTKQPNCKYKLQLGLKNKGKFVSKIQSIAKKEYSPKKNYILVSNVLPNYKYYYRMRAIVKTKTGEVLKGKWTVKSFKL